MVGEIHLQGKIDGGVASCNYILLTICLLPALLLCTTIAAAAAAAAAVFLLPFVGEEGFPARDQSHA